MPSLRRPAAALLTAVLLALSASLAGCVAKAPPAPAELRTSAPPWPAPRDGISYFEAAGVPSSSLDDRSDQHVLELRIEIDGAPVALVKGIGIDGPRALQAPAHTHDDSGHVWLEGRGAREVTLGQFFTLWGVRFDDRCLGAACGEVIVTAAGAQVREPSGLVLWGLDAVQIQLRSVA